MRLLLGVKEIRESDWNALVNESAVATWFQTREAFGFFHSLSFFEAFVVAVENSGRLRGLAMGYVQKDGGKMKQFFSRRAIILGGPLLAEDVSCEELEALLLSLKRYLRKKAIYVEMRNFNDYGRWRMVFEKCGFDYKPHYNVQVDTSSLDVVNGKLDRNRRRNIKKALENGLVIDDSPTKEELARFYVMLDELYRTKVKSPLYPYEFFDRLKETPSSRFFIAKTPDSELIGGLVCVVLKNRAVYAWAACGDDQNHKAFSPSVMTNYAGICYAAENGFPCFDFMGAGKPNDGGYGVRDFKLKFGGELVEHGRFVYICSPLLFSIGKLGVRIMKRQ